MWPFPDSMPGHVYPIWLKCRFINKYLYTDYCQSVKQLHQKVCTIIFCFIKNLFRGHTSFCIT